MKKWIVVQMIVSLLIVSIVSGSVSAQQKFADVEKDFWAKREIEYLAEERIISGYSDGSFRPNQSITRIQAASMIVRALNLESEKNTSAGFKDIASLNDREKQVAAIMEETGIMRGSNGNFRPRENVTRGQMTAVLARAFELERSQEMYFYDVDFNHWAVNDIATVASYRVGGGYADGSFKAYNDTTRAQFSVFLKRALLLDHSSFEKRAPLTTQKGTFVEDAEWIYGITDNQLQKVNKTTSETITLLDIYDIADSYNTEEDDGGSNYDKGDGLRDGTPLQLIGDWIYFSIHVGFGGGSDIDDYTLYKVKKDGTDRKVVSPTELRSIRAPIFITRTYNTHIIGDSMYYVDFLENLGQIQKLNLMRGLSSGGEKKAVSNVKSIDVQLKPRKNQSYSEPFYMQYCGNDLYYYDGKKVIKMNLHSKEQSVIFTGQLNDFIVKKNHLYIMTAHELLYMKTDGTQKKSVAKGQFVERAEGTNGHYIVLKAGEKEKVVFLQGNAIQTIVEADKILEVTTRMDGTFIFYNDGNKVNVMKLGNDQKKILELDKGFSSLTEVFYFDETYYFYASTDEGKVIYEIPRQFDAIKDTIAAPYIDLKAFHNRLIGVSYHSNEWREEREFSLFVLSADESFRSEVFTSFSIPDYRVGKDLAYIRQASNNQENPVTFVQVNLSTGNVEVLEDLSNLSYSSYHTWDVYQDELVLISNSQPNDRYNHILTVYGVDGNESRRLELKNVELRGGITSIKGHLMYIYHNQSDYLKSKPAIVIDMEKLEVVKP